MLTKDRKNPVMATFTITLMILLLDRGHVACDVINRFKVADGLPMSYGAHLGVSRARSLVECILQCSGNRTCQSVSFDPILMTCLTNSYSVDLATVGCNGTACHSRMTLKYATRWIDKVTMRHSCSRDSNCIEPMSECRGGICLCQPGYSYHGNTGRCVALCKTYGTTFQPDEGKALQFSHQGAHTGISNQNTCGELCLKEASFSCKSFEYSSVLKICQLQSFTAYDRPELYTATSKFNLYTRDCA